MEKTSSESNSSWFSRPVALQIAVVALSVTLSSGCAYTRIALDGITGDIPARTGEPPLHVVQCLVETHHDGVAFYQSSGDRGAERDVPGVQRTLQAADPRWFSTTADAQPVIVKIRAESGKEVMTPDDSGFWIAIPAAATLATIPIYSPLEIRLGVSIQLGPGEWSDAEMLPGREDMVWFNPVSQLLFSWFLREKNGWQRQRDDPMTSYGSQAEKFSPAAYLLGGEGKAKANPVFARLLAERIVDAWSDLSPPERRKAMANPMAQKKLEELCPVAPGSATSRITEVPVPAPPGALSVVSPPSVVGSNYDSQSGRGFVVFRRNGTEPIAAHLWARKQVIPDLVGKGRPIRILEETSEPNGTVRISFEVPK